MRRHLFSVHNSAQADHGKRRVADLRKIAGTSVPGLSQPKSHVAERELKATPARQPSLCDEGRLNPGNPTVKGRAIFVAPL